MDDAGGLPAEAAVPANRGRGRSINRLGRGRGFGQFNRGGGRFNRNQNTGPRERQLGLLIPSNIRSHSRSDDEFFAGNLSSPTTEASVTVNIDLDGNCPYAGWKLYFPNEGMPFRNCASMLYDEG